MTTIICSVCGNKTGTVEYVVYPPNYSPRNAPYHTTQSLRDAIEKARELGEGSHVNVHNITIKDGDEISVVISRLEKEEVMPMKKHIM